MSSKCTAAKAYDILGIYDFPDNFDALNGLHSYLYTNSDMASGSHALGAARPAFGTPAMNRPIDSNLE